MNKDSSSEKIEETHLLDRNFKHIALFIVVGIFATTLAQPQVLGSLPLRNILKTQLGVKPTEMAAFFFWVAFAWYFKPFAGILTDAFPLFKTRRRWYLLISAVLAALCWLGMGVLPHTYSSLLWGGIIVNVFMVMASTVVGGFLVEAGQSLEATGRLTAIRIFVSNACTIINGPLSGFLAGHAFMLASGVSAAVVFSIFPVAFIFLRERPVETGNKQAILNAGQQLKTIFSSGSLWIALVFIGLFFFAPGFGTLLYYRQTNDLHLSQQFIGNIGVVAGLAGLLSAAAYGLLIRKLSLRTMILIGVATNGLATFGYLLYNSGLSGAIIDTQNNLFFTLAQLALYDLAARATPVGCEALGYSLIISIGNIAATGGDLFGTYLHDHFNLNFTNMVWINGTTTLFVVVLLPLIPKALVNSRDGAKSR